MAGLFSQRGFSLLVGLLLATLIAFAVVQTGVNDRAIRRELARQAGAQADLLASAVAAPLAFDDREQTAVYVDAVRLNTNVLAAAVYDERNRLVASFARPGEDIPQIARPRTRLTTFTDGKLRVVRPVTESGQLLGTVRMRLVDASPAQRAARNSGIVVFAGLGMLAVAMLAFAQRALRRANLELQARAAELGRANDKLTHEMLERERAEQALRQGQKMEALGQLTGGIAHDFNNLLMAASSGIELLERTEDPKRRAMLSDGVRKAVDRGADLTRQLLAFSRKSPLKPETIDTRRELESSRLLLDRSLRENIEVRVEIAPDIWPIEVDRGELELALLNLAVNARDAMPQGGVLMLTARNLPAHDDQGDSVCISLRDTGHGMSEQVAARVFEPFFTTKDVGKGTGLGLSQVYGFVRSSKGTVLIDGGEGRGAEITLVLPRSLAAPLETQSSEGVSLPKRALRLLFVEDDDHVAEGVGHMLQDLGHAFVRASSASAAIEVLQRDAQFDLLFSDVVMPGQMSGADLRRVVMKRWPGIPILLTTGYGGGRVAPEEKVKVLHKPYGLRALADALEDAAGQAGAPSDPL